MVLTLRELLERIRPAGTPGAPGEGERRQRDRALELIEVTEILREFETEAEAVISAAEAEGRHRQDMAKVEARKISATLADRVAAASASVSSDDRRRTDAEVTAIRADGEREAERIRASGEAGVAAIVEAALREIWEQVGAEPREPG